MIIVNSDLVRISGVMRDAVIGKRSRPRLERRNKRLVTQEIRERQANSVGIIDGTAPFHVDVIGKRGTGNRVLLDRGRDSIERTKIHPRDAIRRWRSTHADTRLSRCDTAVCWERGWYIVDVKRQLVRTCSVDKPH